MISRKELKASAKEALSWNWGFNIALMLISFTLPMIPNFIPILGTLISVIISPAVSYIPQEFFLKIKKGERPQIDETFSAIYKNLGTYWGILIRTFLKLLPFYLIMIVGSTLTTYAIFYSFAMSFVTTYTADYTSILFILGTVCTLIGTILMFTNSLYYVLAIFVKTDNPNMTCKEAVLMSKKLMLGHRLEYFILSLSFIGWIIVSMITCGIALFYVSPYMTTTFATFYIELSSTKKYVDGDNTESVQF